MSEHAAAGALERSQAGDVEAFGELVRLHEGWVRGFLRSRLRDWSSADDLAQDVFVTAFRQIREFRADGSFEAWLRGIAINHFRNFIRKRREEYVGGSMELEAIISERQHETQMGGAYFEALEKCLTRVDEASRALLTDRYVTGKSVRELSEASGRRYSALTMQLHRLREQLAACVQEKLQTSGT